MCWVFSSAATEFGLRTESEAWGVSLIVSIGRALSLFGREGVFSGNAAASDIAENRTSNQKLVLVGVNGVGPHLDHKVVGQRQDLFQPGPWFDRGQRKEEVRQTVPPRKLSILKLPIKVV